VAGALLLIVLLAEGREALHARGPMTGGHEDIACDACHRPAPGSLRQQLQANARYALGLRSSPADFGLQRADSAQCLACHDFPEDRHPVFRFVEPRFRKAREALHPESCISCHLEHRGVRVSIESIDFCEHCHEDTRLKKDPLDVSHEQLIEAGEWQSCLGCHDFHGNHVMTESRKIGEVIAPGTIRAYFGTASSPYSAQKRFEPRREPTP
jgi:hypothetical protein